MKKYRRNKEELILLKQQIKQDHDSGLTYDQISEKRNITYSLVGKYAREMGCGRKKNLSEEEHNEIKRLYDKGMSFKDIAQKIGCSPYAVHYHLMKFPDFNENVNKTNWEVVDHSKEKAVRHYVDKKTKKKYFDVTGLYLHQNEV